jgi:hypothetical protein
LIRLAVWHRRCSTLLRASERVWRDTSRELEPILRSDGSLNLERAAMNDNRWVSGLVVGLLTFGLSVVSAWEFRVISSASDWSCWNNQSPNTISTEHEVSVSKGAHRRPACEVPSTFELIVASTDATSVRLQWAPLTAAAEYAVSRDGGAIGSSIAAVGYFTDFGLRPGESYQYVVDALDAAGTLIARSLPVLAQTTEATTIRTHYTVLAIAFNPEQESLVTEATYLKHRIQFLRLASLRSAVIDLYTGGIVSSPTTPPVHPGTSSVDYSTLVTSRDIPGLDGFSIVDLIEKGDIDHVWVVKTPLGADFQENVLIGNRRIQGEGVIGPNSWQPLPVKSSRSFFVNGYLPDGRSWDAYAHMVEGILTSVSDGHPMNWPRVFPYEVYADHQNRANNALEQRFLNVWERFRLADGWNGTSPTAFASPGNSNAGSSHFLPTTPRTGGYDDYTYLDMQGPAWRAYVDSAADDWLRYPIFNGPKRKVNGYEFGAFNHYVEGELSYQSSDLTFTEMPESHRSFRAASTSFHQWWFARLPHNAGITDGKLNNWWPYLFDFNRFDGSAIDFPVDGFREVGAELRVIRGEYGTDRPGATQWGYWHSENGFSPGGKAANLSVVSRTAEPQYVKSGKYALKVRVQSSQYWEWLGVGRNDVFYPVSRDAHWYRPNLAEVQFSIKPRTNADLLQGTNPIVRLYKNAGHRIELVPVRDGVYANLLNDITMRGADGWYTFRAALAGDPQWEKNVIGYIDPGLSVADRQVSRAQLERDILSDINYVEISIRSTAVDQGALLPPFHVVAYYIDDLRFIDRK